MHPDPRTQGHVPPPFQPHPYDRTHAVPTEPRRKSNVGWIVAVIVAAVLLVVGGLVVVVLVAASPPAGHTIRFEVSASQGQITLVNWSTLEDSALVRNPASPWTHEVELESRSGIVGVNVSGTETVACRLWVDGKLVDEGESSGAVHCGTTVR